MHRESGRKTTDVKQTTDQEPVEAEEGDYSSARNSSVQDCDSSISMRDTDTTSLPPSYEEAQLHHYITKLT